MVGRKERIKMKTRKGYGSMFDTLASKHIDDDETLEALKVLREDLDEKQDVLDNVGVEYDVDLDDYDYAPRDINTDGEDSWKTKYDELSKRYVERFFNGGKENEIGNIQPEEDSANELEEDSANELEEITIDDIIKEKESD